MTYAPTNPPDVPPYQLQPLISNVLDSSINTAGPPVYVRCAQALGYEIYVGSSNGELLRFALQANGPNTCIAQPQSYTLLSRQSVPTEKPVDEIVLTPSISRVLVLSDHQVFVYTLPSLDMIPPTTLRPIRNVITLAVDEQHLRRTPPSSTDPPQAVDPIEFCVIKRTAIAMYSLRERLAFQKEIPLPSGGILARRTGRYLCIADKENYNMIDLEMASLIPLLPLSQTPDVVSVKPSITVISENEFLILSWTGTSTLGLFINGDGDPVRGTLEWPSHPESVCLDYPYITTLLPNNTIEIHSVETQAIMQVISAPLASSSILSQESAADRKKLVVCANGFLIPSSQRSDKLRRIPVRLVRTRGSQVTGEGERASELSEDNVAHMPEDAI